MIYRWSGEGVNRRRVAFTRLASPTGSVLQCDNPTDQTMADVCR